MGILSVSVDCEYFTGILTCWEKSHHKTMNILNSLIEKTDTHEEKKHSFICDVRKKNIHLFIHQRKMTNAKREMTNAKRQMTNAKRQRTNAKREMTKAKRQMTNAKRQLK